MWKWIKSIFKKEPKVEVKPAPVIPMPKPPAYVDITPWMTVIYNDIKNKVKEIPGPENHPRIVAAHKAAGLKPSQQSDLTAWCASYGKLVMLDTGVKPERLEKFHAWARDGLKFGVKLDKFRYGCVVILERNEPGGDSHWTYGVKINAEGTHILCAGGNQNNRVCEEWYQVKDVLGYRYPDDDMLRDMGVI